MVISSVFNRRFHAMLKEFQYAKSVLVFRDERYPQGALYMHPRSISYQSFKDLIKQVNLDFPKDVATGLGVSTTVLTNKDMVQHLEWFRMVAGDNGFSFSRDDEDWQRLLVSAGIYEHNKA